MKIDLSESEHALLVEILREEYGRLRAEIYRTDTSAFKTQLKVREETLAALLERLEPGSSKGAA